MMHIIEAFVFRAADDTNATAMRRLPSKVRGANLPPEYELMQLIKELDVVPPDWNTLTPVCQWKGVHCDLEKRVTGIHMPSQSFSGALNWEMLPRSLKFLNVRLNRLTGGLPLLTLPPLLIQLDTDSNCLRGKVELQDLPVNSRKVILDDNQFVGDINLSCLPKELERLSIAENTFSGGISLTDLPLNMVYLKLSDNELNGPLNLTHLPQLLERLFLDHNCFSGLVSFDMLPQCLEYLWVSNNLNLIGEVTYLELPESLRKTSPITRIDTSGTNIVMIKDGERRKNPSTRYKLPRFDFRGPQKP